MTVHIPLSLKMSATWENEKLSSSIVPRICNLNITQVVFDRLMEDKMDSNHNNFFVAIRMRDNSRRVLRSPELAFPTSAPGIVQLDFSCSIQYSHALKRDSSNLLQLLLQRRKKYKKKSVNLGYKTLAYCTIDLAQVLQRKIDNKFLDLYDDPKLLANQIARIEVQSLTTCPAEKDSISDRRKEFYEEEDEGMHEQFSEPEDSDRADDSDYDPNCGEYAESRSRQKKMMKAMSDGISGHHRHRRSSSPSTALPEWQKQIKQKIMGLLKKVKLMEHSEELDPRDTCQLWDEIDQLENVSEDSDIGDMDTLSIQSTPRPTLRPFFGHSGVPNHAGTEGSEDTLSAEAGAKLLKKLQLETSGNIGQSIVSSINTSEVISSAGDKNRVNDGSETTEDESKSFTLVKKHSYSHEKDTLSQSMNLKNKAKSKNPNSLTSANPTKKDQQKQKKPITGIMKTFSLSTAASTVSSSIVMSTASSSKFSQGELPFYPGSNDLPISTGISSTNYSISPGSSLMTSSAILTPLTTEAVNDSYPTDVKLSLDTNNGRPQRRSRQRSSSIPHEMAVNSINRSYESDSCVNNVIFAKHNLNNTMLFEPRQELVEQVNEYLSTHSESLEVIYIINLSDFGGKHVTDLFIKEHIAHIAVASFADTKFALTQIINRIRKKSDLIKICLLGGDCHLSSVLRVFVDQMNLNYSKEIVNCFRFFLIPITGFCLTASTTSNSFINPGNTIHNSMARRLCSIDSKYASLFAEFIQLENISSSYSIVERNNKFLFGVHDYLQANNTLQCPIGDCLIACSVRQQNMTQDCESSAESFIPFVCEVRLGETSDVVWSKNDGSMDDQWLNSTSSSPPRSPIIGNVETNIKSSFATSSPVSITTTTSFAANSQNIVSSSQPNNQIPFSLNDSTSLELQLEYWTDHSAKKVSLKSAFRQVLVSPIISNTYGANTQHLLYLTIISREKKQKIMRIAKKPKHDVGDSKKETFDDVNRILCTSKSQNSAIRVTIDGVNWTGVKFFQLSPYWRTQIKTFPIATFNN